MGCNNKGLLGIGTRLMVLAMLCVAGVGVSGLEALAAQAREMHIQVQDADHFMEYKMVPDDPGHVLALAQRQGTARLKSGQKAEYSAYSIIDARVGQRGVRRGYSILSFADGSKIFLAWRADSQRNKQNLPSLKGQGTISKGTGKYQGIKGTMQIRSVQIKPTSLDPKRTRITELIISYTLP